MKISNFRDYKKISFGFADQIESAIVDVETGFFRKKIVSREVFIRNVDWRFLDSGEFCPGFAVANMAAAYLAQKSLKRSES